MSGSTTTLLLLALLAILVPGSGARAQSAADRLRQPFAPPLSGPGVIDPGPLSGATPDASASPDPSRVALYSLVLPGAGQLAQGQRRGIAYAAVEALAWVLHFDRRGSGHDLRDRYRDLAWDVARGMTGPRVVADFEYYEQLSKWPSSGAWDLDAATPGLQPETDPSTYNGAIWERAAAIFFASDPDVGPTDPRWTKALAYYEERAFPPELLWSWSGDPGAQDRFEQLLEDSDRHLEEATLMIGFILANHVVSAADALVSARLRQATDGRVEGGLAWRRSPRRPGDPVGALTFSLTVRP